MSPSEAKSLPMHVDECLAMLADNSDRVHFHHFPGLSANDLYEFLAAMSGYSLLKNSDGELSVVVNKGRPRDYSSNGEVFDAHTDGLYYERPPQFALLYCLQSGQKQVPTFFIDTTNLIEILSESEPSALAVLRDLDQVFVARDGREYRRPVIEINPIDGNEVMNITLGRAYLRPAVAQSTGKREPHQHETIAAFQRLLARLPEARSLVHAWSPGDLLLWDNHRFIHGRGDANDSVGRSLIRAWFSPSTGLATSTADHAA